MRAYVALGSNLGDRAGYLALAREQLGRLPETSLVAASAVEETAPLGGIPQPAYLNQMVALETALAPRDLLAACQRIEALAGRVRRERWASRTLDLDLVRYDEMVLQEPGLELPHPGLSDRPFWQRELAELTGRLPSVNQLPSWAQVSPRRLAHIERVAALADRWSREMPVSAEEGARWMRAVWLHDALRDAPEHELQSLVPGLRGPVELLHGPAAAARAEAMGERDAEVLEAIRYHSVGLAGWGLVGRVLYCADFLEPGRSFDRQGRAALAGRFPADPHGVLYDVAKRRLTHAIDHGWSIPEPTIQFWNSLAGGPSQA